MLTRYTSLFVVALLLLALLLGRGIAIADSSCGKVKGTYTFRMVPATSFAPFYDGDPPSGRDSGVYSAPRQDILRVGVFTIGASCSVSGHTIATTDDGASTVVIDFNWTGTASLNTAGDGTGTLNINNPAPPDSACSPAQAAGVCATFEGAETYAFVAGRGEESRSLELIQTDNAGGGAKIFMTGRAGRREND